MFNSFVDSPAIQLPQSRSLVVTIEGIATGTPKSVTPQQDAAKFVASLPKLDQNRHRIEKIYKNTRIEQRHLATNLLSLDNYKFSIQPGNIEQRMAMFEQAALPLATDVAKKALQAAQASTIDNDDACTQKIEDSIGLIVFITSTGFIAPGIDAKLIKKLGLRRNIARIPIHFMGCAAAMNGLRVACDHIQTHPSHKALVICLELSSINAVFEDNLNDIIIHSIFSDGCAAVVMGACEEENLIGKKKVILKDNFSSLVENTEDGITLGIKDNGITCKLSPNLPSYIETGIAPIINNVLEHHQWSKEDIDLWAIHPGGTRIIEKAQAALGLHNEQIVDSWGILRQYGNMLSCSILFVIERMILRIEKLPLNGNESHFYHSPHKSTDKLRGVAFSFAPGVSVEGLLFEII